MRKIKPTFSSLSECREHIADLEFEIESLHIRIKHEREDRPRGFNASCAWGAVIRKMEERRAELRYELRRSKDWMEEHRIQSFSGKQSKLTDDALRDSIVRRFELRAQQEEN